MTRGWSLYCCLDKELNCTLLASHLYNCGRRGGVGQTAAAGGHHRHKRRAGGRGGHCHGGAVGQDVGGGGGGGPSTVTFPGT